MKTVFFDVDTQIDFMFPAGALYVPGAEKIVPVIAALNRHAAAGGIPVISTMDAHAENDPEFRDWPPHCVAGTVGQMKPQETLLAKRVTVPAEAAPLPDLHVSQIIVVEKVSTNVFTNPNLEPVLENLQADRYVVYGVVTEICVKFAALGLLKTGKRVEVVTDAVKHLNESARDAMFAEFTAGGGVLTSAAEVCR
jgi:nicotinamidase/pyrazinamidase